MEYQYEYTIKGILYKVRHAYAYNPMLKMKRATIIEKQNKRRIKADFSYTYIYCKNIYTAT